LNAVLNNGSVATNKTMTLQETADPSNNVVFSSTALNLSTATNSLAASASAINMTQGPYAAQLTPDQLLMTDASGSMFLTPDSMRFVQGVTTTRYTSSTLEGNFDISGNVNFENSPLVPLVPVPDNSAKVASTLFVKSALLSFVQGGTTGSVGGVSQVVFDPTYPFTATPHILLTPFGSTGSAAVSSTPTGPSSTQFWCNLTDCSIFNWVAMASV
jgi:hypothetical protein